MIKLWWKPKYWVKKHHKVAYKRKMPKSWGMQKKKEKFPKVWECKKKYPRVWGYKNKEKKMKNASFLEKNCT